VISFFIEFILFRRSLFKRKKNSAQAHFSSAKKTQLKSTFQAQKKTAQAHFSSPPQKTQLKRTRKK
jgi:hypothetical protein